MEFTDTFYRKCLQGKTFLARNESLLFSLPKKRRKCFYKGVQAQQDAAAKLWSKVDFHFLQILISANRTQSLKGYLLIF